MSSNGNSAGPNNTGSDSTDSDGGPANDGPANGGPPTGLSDVAIGGTSALTFAATAVARVQGEIDDLWRDSMRIENDLLAERLVEVSHALQRAARLLEQDRAIG